MIDTSAQSLDHQTKAEGGTPGFIMQSISLRIQLLARKGTDLVRHFLPHGHLFLREVLQIFSACVQESSKPEAGAIELANDHRSPMSIDGDEVCSPQKRDVLLRQTEGCNVLLQLSLQLRLDGLQRKLSRVREVGRAGRVNGSLGLAAHATDVDVVLNSVQLLANHDKSSFTLVDTRAEALINHLTPSLDSTLEVLARAFGFPCAGLLSAAVLTPFNELCNRVLLDVIVVRLLQYQHFRQICDSVAILLAIVSLLEVNNPNSFSSGTTILLDDSLLESNRLGEPVLNLLRRIVSQSVRKAEVHILDFCEGVLRTHKLHVCRSRPDWNLCSDLCHRSIELLLITTVRGDLPGIDSHHDGIEIWNDFEEAVVLVDVVEQNLHCQARIFQAIGDPDGVEPVAAGDLVTSTGRVGVNVAPDECDTILGVLRIILQVIIVFRLVSKACNINCLFRILRRFRFSARRFCCFSFGTQEFRCLLFLVIVKSVQSCQDRVCICSGLHSEQLGNLLLSIVVHCLQGCL